MKQLFTLGSMLAVVAITLNVGRAQDFPVDAGKRPAQLLSELRSALDRGDWARSEVEFDRLIGLGSEAIPVVLAELMRNEGSRGYRSQLLGAIARMKPEAESTRALVELALTHPDAELVRMAGNRIDNRIIDFPLTPKELTSLIERVSSESGELAAQWAYALARATYVNDHLLVEPTVRRFKRAITDGLPEGRQYLGGGYLSDEVLYLNGFLRAFWSMDRGIATDLLQREIVGTADSRIRMWLTIGAGANGDEAVAEELLDLMQSEELDISVRAVALRAYAKALQEKAIPILDHYRSDRTPGPNPRFPPLATVARSELAKLNKRDAVE